MPAIKEGEDVSMLKILNVTKSYSKLKALDSISFESGRNNIVGVVGHNGAGKTTLFMIANGFLRPCSGDVVINNTSLSTNRKKIQTITGLYTDKLQLYPILTVKECLMYFLHAFGQKRKMYDKLVELFKLSDFVNKSISDLSTGMLKKVSLAVSLTNGPKILFLDEPFSGLDPNARIDFAEIIKLIWADEKIQIVISSHDLSELESVIDSLLVLKEGRLLANSTMHNLMASYFTEKIILVDVYSSLKGEIDKLWDRIKDLNESKVEKPKTLSSDLYRFKIDAKGYQLLTNLLSENTKIISIYDYKPSLDDLYFEITKVDTASGVELS